MTEPGVVYTLRMTSTEPVYAVTTVINEYQDAIADYPLVVHD